MNNGRRNLIEMVMIMLSGLLNVYEQRDKAYIIDIISQAISKTSSIYEDEEDSYNNIPENLQNSDRALAMEEALDSLEEASLALEDALCILEMDEGDIEDAMDNVFGAIECLKEAVV